VTGEVRCAVASDLADESLAGTAPVASTWLLVEQSGPWGRQALTESHLDPHVGGSLAFAAHDTGVKILLVRRPGRHADDHHAPEHRAVWLAHTAPTRTWMRRLDVADLAEVLALDLRAAGAGVEPEVGVRDDQPLLLICTNAKRDQCCAIDGRPAVEHAARLHPDRVWECSHLGGHRFAATALVLPFGLVHGRLDGASSARLLDLAADGQLDLTTLRGRSTWSEAGQAAEIAIRRQYELNGIDDVVAVDAVTVERTDDDEDLQWTVGVRIADGPAHRVRVGAQERADVLRPESCVKSAVPVRTLVVDAGTNLRP
jgi:hypothetical protein